MTKLDWVKEVKPEVPTNKNSWGKNFTDYHLDKDYAIEIHADGKLIKSWTWASQSDAGSKTVPNKYWDEKSLKALATKAKSASRKL